MKFVSDPTIARKVAAMQQRVRWQHPLIQQLGIDQTRLVLEPAIAPDAAFKFCVLGDSGNGQHRGDSPQRRVSQLMQSQASEAKFVLHTGDVVYLVGSSEQYQENFIQPYQELLVGGSQPQQIAYNQMVFNQPFLPVLGNHDYYDLPVAYGLLSQLLWPLKQVFRYHIDLDVGWHGSYQGDAYAQAFLDYLKDVPDAALKAHLERHYTAQTSTGRGLCYQPQKFTRLPNRYYRFRYGGIDFFALDSNTFNAPRPIGTDASSQQRRQHLIATRNSAMAQLDTYVQQIKMVDHQPSTVESQDQLDELLGQIEQVEESIRDIEKQLAPQTVDQSIDQAQLDWLYESLVESWQDSSVRGRMIYFHHPPYVTEATKWDQGQTLAVRHYLRTVFDRVAQEVSRTQQQSIVDLVLCGHAHCFEYLQTLETGHADRHTQWVICGGSGFSLRRQRREGHVLQEEIDGELRDVAISRGFWGKTGHGADKRRTYSFLEVEVSAGEQLQFRLKPHMVEYQRKKWNPYQVSLAFS
ncbi:metallophosphoesterase [filamentous cyanobacterium LEGE 11480]|uniref:Metallophosphoesterase n=1 Tax=Romeriopsis navalis LEGE 11480 TaxID=2777977 RepID=A0A928Z5L0_9CYAN|nr:metallophosphoesterase [Romeriopsis navalis]MBE9031385.1 metallophosphoesterase [Romeriopsis navalis LEGE 11480]